jgi:hypothetical protein
MGERMMLTLEENELLCRVEAKTEDWRKLGASPEEVALIEGMGPDKNAAEFAAAGGA